MSLKSKCKDTSDLESPLGESKVATVASGLSYAPAEQHQYPLRQENLSSNSLQFFTTAKETEYAKIKQLKSVDSKNSKPDPWFSFFSSLSR